MEIQYDTVKQYLEKELTNCRMFRSNLAYLKHELKSPLMTKDLIKIYRMRKIYSVRVMIVQGYATQNIESEYMKNDLEKTYWIPMKRIIGYS